MSAVQYFEWERFIKAFGQILPYLRTTLILVTWTIVIGAILGMAIARIRLKKIPFLSMITVVYISFFRGTPLLIQMMLSYYGLPVLLSMIGINANHWDKLIFAIIAYTLNRSAFLAEIFRSSIEAIPKGQTEAALSVGLTEGQTFRRIVLPQVIRIALPAFSTDFVGLFQATSLVYLLGIMDLMGRAKALGTATNHFLEAYLVCIIIFVVISILLKLIFHKVEGIFEYSQMKG